MVSRPVRPRLRALPGAEAAGRRDQRMTDPSAQLTANGWRRIGDAPGSLVLDLHHRLSGGRLNHEDSAQVSSDSPGTLANSRVLLVTNVLC